MNIQELNKLFNEGGYVDYTLAEYELCRYFISQVKPKIIKVIGGYTNLDLFYSCQELDDVKVTNWEPGDQVKGDLAWYNKFEKYKKLTGFKGEYEWVPKSVRRYSEIGDTPDLLWANNQIDMEWLIPDIQEWPAHIIYPHSGNLIRAESVLKISRHRPLRAIGKRLAIFSEQDIDLTKGTGYSYKISKFLSKEVMEIIK